MLRNQGIRTKLLAVLALPIVALIVMATLVSLQTFDRARQASEVQKLAQGADTLGQLVTAIQSERSISAQLLDKKPVGDQVAKARKNTDAALLKTRALIGSVDITTLSPQAVAAVAAASAGHGQLSNVRDQVDSGYAQPDRISERYTSMIASDISLSARIGSGLTDRAIGRQLNVYSSAQTLAEVATQERELVLSMIGQGTVNQASAGALASLQAQELQASNAFHLDGTAKQKSDLDAAVYLPVQDRASYATIKAGVLALANGDKVKVDSSQWRNVSNDRLAALQKLLPSIAHDVASEAAAASSSASNQALLVLFGGLLLVGLLLGLGLVLARAITRPLRHLTHIAGEIADELPRMVERMATPGEGPGITLPEIPFTGKDEVGQLAEAFREVNDMTVHVAEEQAALRASIAEMFVNVARRNHVLLSRQLSFIDQLERSEENPDTLDNLFRLDHLATRMRRNAESLIVLAGIDAGRRLRRPMPLSDVIRTAVSEIERYDRVDLALQADPPMVGHVALTTAHLLAELLENATQFSNPDTRVISSTAFSPRGVRITITDLGLGMTWDEINEANQRISSPPATEVVGSQRLGFYVVGRLARRLDATVELKPGRAQGTVVTIDLPPALFVTGTVTESTQPLEPFGADDQASVDGPTGPEGGAAASRLTSPSGLPAREGSLPAGAPPVPATPSSSTVAAPDGGLPRRSTSAAAAPAASAAAPAADDVPAAPRSGMFNSFRSRRAVESQVSASAPVEATSLEALAQELPEFVPTLDTATPALPHRELHEEVDTDSIVTDDGVPTLAPAGPEQRDDVELVVPGLADADDAQTASLTLLPARVVDPLGDDWEPQETHGAQSSSDLPADQPLVALLAHEPDPAADVAVAQPIVEPMVEPVVEPELAPVSSLPEADDVQAGSQARSTLSELARESAPAPQEGSAGGAAAPALPEVPATPVVAIGAPALDILPSRPSGRGLHLRRTSRPKASHSSHAALPAHSAQSPVVPAAYSAPATAPAPVTPLPVPARSVTSSPTFAAPPADVPDHQVPVPAPSSLFVPAPAPVDADPLPEAMPTPAFPAASVPALVAAQSLRERSAMASEALSELSALSTYRPESVTGASAPASLVRRTPQATPAAQIAQPQEPQGPRRVNRNAADVRSMLSGFRAGVERGRTTPGGAAGAAAHPYPEAPGAGGES
jgi:signal transduction histidine kinase